MITTNYKLIFGDIREENNSLKTVDSISVLWRHPGRHLPLKFGPENLIKKLE
jgi:hypothetical protein